MHQGVHQIEPRFWESPAFQRSIPELPFVLKASRARRPGSNAIVPAIIAAVVFVVILGPLWPRLPVIVPSALSELSEWAPLIVIIAAAVLSEFFADLKLKATRKHSKLYVTREHIEFYHPRGNVKHGWNEISDLSWDSDPGNKIPYLVAQLSGPAGVIRISEQFFRDSEVRLVYGLTKLKLKEPDDLQCSVSNDTTPVESSDCCQKQGGPCC